jgi:hypothetical protein
MAKLKDRQIVAICEAELDAAGNFSSAELSEHRADALEYYHGEPYGDEKEGRSQIRTREVLDTIEWVMPSLMRIFADRENIVTFDPFGPEDEAAAQQESDMVSHVYWKKNRGFFNTYTFIKDALLSKTGILKVWWDETPWETREEYRNLNEIEMSMLLNDSTVDREVIDFEIGQQGINLTCTAKSATGRVRVEPIAPEEFGLSRTATTPYAKDAPFSYQRSKKTKSQLVEEGYPRSLIKKLPSQDAVETEERLARRNLDDEQESLSAANHESLQEVWVTECYIKLDRDDDGIAELLKVTLATGGDKSSSSSTMLDIEEVDRVPFATVTPILLTHKFYGLSLADLVMDLQRIKSQLMRGVLDNMYLANNGRPIINDLVNLDDVLLSRPGSPIRVDGDMPPQNSVSYLQHPSVPPEVFGLMEYMDEHRKDRTGVGDEVAALDPKALKDVNTGVAALAYDAARAKIELMAEIFAEVGFRTVFEDIHEVMAKSPQRAQVAKLRGEWVEVDPGRWRSREDVTIQVGVGVASKERRIIGHQQIYETHRDSVSAGFQLANPDQMVQNIMDWCREMGHDPRKYYTLPSQLPPPPPEPPDPQIAALELNAQVEMEKTQVAREKNRIEMAKLESGSQLDVLQLENRSREAMMRAQLDSAKNQLKMLQVEYQAANNQQKQALALEVNARELAIKGMEMRFASEHNREQLSMDKYKAELTATTSLASTAESGDSPPTSETRALLDEMRKELESTRAALDQERAPKVIIRDDDGLISAIGDKMVIRDESGQIQRVESPAGSRQILRDDNGRVVGLG